MEDTVGGIDRRVPQLLVGASALLAVVVLAEVLLRALGVIETGGSGQLVMRNEFLVGVATTVPFVVGLAYAGYWLERSDLSPDRYRRVALWCVGGTASFLAINVALMAVIPSEFWVVVAWIRWAVAFGAGIGAFVGVTEGRAIHSALAAERTALRAEHLEAQRDLLDYLNSLLRHEVLNAVNVIGGYASLLVEQHDPDDRRRDFAETVLRQSEDMSRVIQDVRVLLNATQGETDFAPVDLVEVLDTELRKLADAHGDVQVDLDAPDEAHVYADVLVARVFGNLLSNAVEHNDAERPRVEVAVAVDEETVTVTVADDGPGVPDSVVETLFERPRSGRADHGLGLYLVGRLVDHYDGEVELTETGPEGSVFTVQLPRAAPETDGAAATGRTNDPVFVDGPR